MENGSLMAGQSIGMVTREEPVTARDVERAARRIADVVRETPVLRTGEITRRVGAPTVVVDVQDLGQLVVVDHGERQDDLAGDAAGRPWCSFGLLGNVPPCTGVPTTNATPPEP